MSKFLELFVN